MSKKTSIWGSFSYAAQGIGQAFKTEPNFRIHIIAAVISTIAAYLLKFTQTEWLMLFFAIALVVVLELINTAIEKIVDMVSPRYSKSAKIIKDVSAAAVMISSLLAILVGALLFLPRLMLFLG